MVDIKRIKAMFIESGFVSDGPAADLFCEAAAEFIEDVIRESIRGAFEENKNGSRHGGGSYSSGPRGEDRYDSSSPFPFGKYGPKGDAKTFGEVPSSYYEWLMEQEWIQEWAGVVRYIRGDDPPPPQPQEPAGDDDTSAPF